MASEKNFENKIKQFLKEHNCYYVKYFANRMTKVGVPDILACVNGYFVGIEVKAENGVPSELHIYNIEQIHNEGGIGVIVKPSQWEEFKSLIEALLDDNTDHAFDMDFEINYKFF